MAHLTLVGADVISTPHIVSEGFNPAQSRRPRSVQDLQDEFIAEEIRVLLRAGLSPANHGGFEQHIVSKPRQLTVHLVGVLFDREQLIAKECFPHCSSVEGAVTDEFAATVLQETNLVHERPIVGNGLT